ncbi:hypothetical protein SprV_0602132600 [Sparganum proliferum]
MVNFYRRFLPHCADTILPFTSLLSGPKGSFELSADALTAFDKVKAVLADVTLLTYSSPDAPISLMVDAFNVAVGSVPQQHLAGRTQSFSFFSRNLSPAETRYSTFGRELLAVFLAVKHSRHLLEGRDFTVFTDHKSLSFDLKSTSDKLNPRGNIRHIDGSRNEVADALSRPSIAHLQLSPGIYLDEMAAERRRVRSPCNEDVSGLQLQDLSLTTGNGTIISDVSITFHRHTVPPFLCRKVFSSLHNHSHPGTSVSESYLDNGLATCSHVYLRCDRVRRPLEPPYDGPFRVISRGMKNFRIQRGILEEVVSVNRLKAAVPVTPPDEPCNPLPPASPP